MVPSGATDNDDATTAAVVAVVVSRILLRTKVEQWSLRPRPRVWSAATRGNDASHAERVLWQEDSGLSH
jgi:hypothetical protein